VPARLTLRLAAFLGAAATLAYPAVVTAQVAGPQLVSDRDVTVWVDDTEAAASAIAAQARELGGELVEQQPQRVTVRVPAGQVSTFVEGLAAEGRLQVRRGSSRDTSFERAELEARLRRARGQRSRLGSMLAKATSVDDSLGVERALAPVDAEIARLTSEIAALDRSAALVTVRIDLQPRDAVIPEAVPAFALPFPWVADLSLPTLLDTSHREPPGPPARRIRSALDLGVALDLLDLDREDPEYAGELALHMRGVWDTDPVGFATGLDLGLGGGQGFVYEAAFLLGFGASIGEVSALGLVGGIGANGWTGDRVPGSMVLPVELFATLEFGDAGRLILFAQPRWAPTSHSRRHGSDHTPFGDELRVGGAVTIPALLGLDTLESGGLRVGFAYTELVDSRLYVATVGLGSGLVEY
jgi:hypothetical protein